MWTGIELLHILQDIRLEYPFLEDFFTATSSKVTYLVIPVALAILFYLCIDKKQGEILGLSFISSFVFAVVSKYGFNQPRPWDLDPTIIKVEGVNANGLSLPSGHTSAAVSAYLPAAIFVKNRPLAAVLIAFMLLIVAGRLVLCVHTPLDIISGTVVGLIAFAVAWKSMDYAYDDDRAYHLVNTAYVVFFTVLFIVGMVYWGASAEKFALHAGCFYGMFIGRTLDRLYLRYEIPHIGVKEHALRFVIGIVMCGLILLVPALVSPQWGLPVGGAAMMVWAFFIYPFIITKKQLFCRGKGGTGDRNLRSRQHP